MAGFVMMALIAGLIVYISIAKHKKRAMLISVVMIASFFLYVNYSCGPNRSDVKVMKPMAEKISAYIVKNGIPESLKDIPDLPYGLEGCKKEIIDGYNRKPQKYITKNTNWIEIEEICYFKSIAIHLKLNKDFKSKITEWNGSFKMISDNNTSFFSWINPSENGKIVFENFGFTGKKTGICNEIQLKQ